MVPGRITPRQASEQARAAARQRLREARETAGLSLRRLAAAMNDHGHPVGFAHLARVESGERSLTRDLVLAWGAATGQADPQAWAREVVEVLGQQRLGRSRQVLEMEFRPPQPTEVPDVLRAGDLSCRIRSPEAIYARVTGLLGQALKAAPGDDQPVVITTCGPLARAFREAAQSIAPGAIVPVGPDARKLVQLAAAPTPEERLRAVEEMLAASAVAPRLRFPARARPRACTNPWSRPVPPNRTLSRCPASAALSCSTTRAAGACGCRFRAMITRPCGSIVTRPCGRPGPAGSSNSPGPGQLVNQYWYKEWETKLLEQEEDAEERLFLQPHLGVHTMTPELAASQRAAGGARRGTACHGAGHRILARAAGGTHRGLPAQAEARRVPVPGYRLLRDGHRHGRGRLHPHPQHPPARP